MHTCIMYCDFVALISLIKWWVSRQSQHINIKYIELYIEKYISTISLILFTPYVMFVNNKLFLDPFNK